MQETQIESSYYLKSSETSDTKLVKCLETWTNASLNSG